MDGPYASHEVILSRIQLLENIWKDPCFRPFDTVESSTAYLKDNMEQNFIIRLSTSAPGGITLTFRKALKSDIIVHTRFFVNDNGKVVDAHKNEHADLSSLAKWFAESKYTTPATPAGYICIKM